jgi:hypothetical protein
MSLSEGLRRNVAELCIPLVLVLGCLTGCAKRNGSTTDEERINHAKQIDVHAQPSSASDFLGVADFKEFQSGRSEDKILKAVQWRGNFIEAAEYKGRCVSEIAFGLSRKDALKPEDVAHTPFDEEESVLAIFADDKFEKFVLNPTNGDSRRIKIGDSSWLIPAVEGKPINISDIAAEIKKRPAVPSHIDPGLTVVSFLLSPFIRGASEKDYKENAALRDQYNAARLRIGMSVAEVEAVLKAKPIESGDVEAGAFKIYGSAKSFDIRPPLRYSDILVVFREGKVRWIFGFTGGERGLLDLRDWFSDLPLPRGSAK